MNKNLIVRTLLATVMMGASAASMAAANNVGSHSSNITGSFVNATCTVVEWPQDVAFDPISVSDWAKYTANQPVQTKSHGKFVLDNCPANTAIKYSVSVPHVADGNIYQAFGESDDGKVVKGFGVLFSGAENFANVWRLDGQEANLGRTNDQGQLTTPAYVRIVKRGNLNQDGASWDGGNFKVVATYNVSYD
ncbi:MULTISPECIES: hypothetical protein [Cronobacter]|uniref:hypothetical protein n=1 Tax=Cronobacter TaxID=413496 RepID=UPI0013150A38|nr:MULTISPECIES: hypothetical protein [Cronobacter]EIZ9238683.1 hypothetical protein [Cronobacter sakazakii]ELY4753229.1 hypothetical protein [Cronobacter sakazakii]MDT3591018.1 hypothetical protein [Cronobacter sakazakii]WRU16632.1 hypothetical protein U9L39_21245 [Cronobacter malonaticus]